MTNEFNLSEKEIQDLINHGFATVNGVPLSTLSDTMSDSEYSRRELQWEIEYRRTHGMREISACESCQERAATRETIGGLLCEQCRSRIEAL